MSGIGGVLSGAGNLLGAVLSYQQAQDAAQSSETFYEQAGQAGQAQTMLSQAQLDLAREQWDRYKRLYGPLEEAAAREYQAELDLYRPLKQAQADAARKDLATFGHVKEVAASEALGRLGLYRPLEQSLVAEAMQGVDADVAGARGRAAADVRQSFASARDAARRKAQGLGLDPSRLAHLEALGDLEQAAAEAAARTRAGRLERQRAEETGFARRAALVGSMPKAPAAPYAGGLNTPGARLPGDPAARAMGLLGAASSNLSGAAGTYAGLGAGLASSGMRGIENAFSHLGGLAQGLGSMDWTFDDA